MRPLPTVVLALLATTLGAQVPIPSVPLVRGDAARPVDLAICLDVSGSMEGLIHAARQNLWAVVNDLARLQPTPVLRVALLTYGCSAHDAEQGWVKVESGFTTDLDEVSRLLFALGTNGGDEYVARVVQRALDSLQWSHDPQALKLLFVAGNEAATQDPKLDSAAAARAAIARGIVVNTIYCGNPLDELAPAWRAVAQAADGQFAAIDKDDATVIPTPFDEQLAALSTAMNATYVPYGAERQVWAANQAAQDGNAVGMNPAAAAERCQTKAGGLYWNAHWDLVDACEDPKFELEKVRSADLPEQLRALSLEELRRHIATQRRERGAIREQVESIAGQRDAFLAAERARLGGAGQQRFETVVLEAVRQQAEARGFRRAAAPAPAAPAASGEGIDARFTAVIAAAAREYRRFPCVTGAPRAAPTDCRLPAPPVRRSASGGEHGGKLYLLYARQADGSGYVRPGEPARVGQTLVKEAWQRVHGEPAGVTEAGTRYLATPVLRDGDQVSHAGDAHGLFVMHKLPPATDGTDQGWIYGTVDRDGVVTGAGRMGSCMRCHQDAPEDRRFGLR